MTKKRCLVLAVAAIAVCIAIVSGAAVLMPERPGLSRTNFDKVHIGMSRDDVEGILGRPLGQEDRIDEGIIVVVWGSLTAHKLAWSLRTASCGTWRFRDRPRPLATSCGAGRGRCGEANAIPFAGSTLMAWFIECPFCHKSIFRWFYAWHESHHTAIRPDGQMNEHITAAPKNRFEGSLDGVPKAYVHAKCGVATGMPEEIIRTYLVLPLTYNDSSFCCGCGNYVIGSELHWVETGESLMDYNARMRCQYLRDSLGIDPMASEIIFTPGTAERLQEIAGEFASSSAYHFCLELIRTDFDVQYKLDLLEHADPKLYDLITINTIPLAIKKKQRDRLKGTLIHFNALSNAFTIARLYAWK
jgi:hypothetical protein